MWTSAAAAHHDPQAAGDLSPGGIGGGAFAQGLPALGSLVAGLASAFRRDVLFARPGRPPVHAGRLPPARAVRRCRHRRRPGAGAAGGALGGDDPAVCPDHLGARYDRMLSFWGYPVGAVAVGLSRTLRVPAAVMLLGAETADLPALGYGHLGRPVSRRLVIETCRRAAALVAVSATS